MALPCLRCNADLSRFHTLTKFCLQCKHARERDPLVSGARNAVTKAVSSGALPPAKTQSCVDCGKQARDYDHRDYHQPLLVVPVCRSCNKLRGPGIGSLALTRAQILARQTAPANQTQGA